MAFTDEQKQTIASWIEDGAKPADVQARLEKDFDVRLTYMEVRFLIDDLKVMPKDPTPPPAPEKPVEEAAPLPPEEPVSDLLSEDAPIGGGAGVTVKVDDITRPGAMVSGRATFSDGQTSEWYLDQYGRLGMIPATPGYRPPQQDIMTFQAALEKELVRLGL